MGDYGLTVGTAELQSSGPITFGPDEILFVADSMAAKIYAVDVADTGPVADSDPFDVEDVDVRIGSFLGCDAADVLIRDIAVHPVTHHVYASVRRGGGADGTSLVLRIDALNGSIGEVSLTDVPMSSVTISDAPSADDERRDITLPLGDEGEEITVRDRTIRIVRSPIRNATVTDLAYVDGMLLVAGMSNEEFSSKLRRIPFPFTSDVTDNNLEIFHVSHGKWETAAPIRTFVPYEGGTSILASYTCTPVVHFPLSDLAPGTKTVGRTVAELGAMNQPLDMVSFQQDGGEHLLIANSTHGLIKIACADIDVQTPLTEPGQPRGVARKTEELKGVRRLANLNDSYVLALQLDGDRHHLRSLKTSAL